MRIGNHVKHYVKHLMADTTKPPVTSPVTKITGHESFNCYVANSIHFDCRFCFVVFFSTQASIDGIINEVELILFCSYVSIYLFQNFISGISRKLFWNCFQCGWMEKIKFNYYIMFIMHNLILLPWNWYL